MPTLIGRHLYTPPTLTYSIALNQPTLLLIHLFAHLHIYVSYSTFHISKTLNHLSALSRACLASLRYASVCYRSSGTRRGMQQLVSCISYRFSFLCRILLRDFEQSPDMKVRSRLELSLGGVGRLPCCPVTDCIDIISVPL